MTNVLLISHSSRKRPKLAVMSCKISSYTHSSLWLQRNGHQVPPGQLCLMSFMVINNVRIGTYYH